jgi:hypothetical protein
MPGLSFPHDIGNIIIKQYKTTLVLLQTTFTFFMGFIAELHQPKTLTTLNYSKTVVIFDKNKKSTNYLLGEEGMKVQFYSIVIDNKTIKHHECYLLEYSKNEKKTYSILKFHLNENEVYITEVFGKKFLSTFNQMGSEYVFEDKVTHLIERIVGIPHLSIHKDGNVHYAFNLGSKTKYCNIGEKIDLKNITEPRKLCNLFPYNLHDYKESRNIHLRNGIHMDNPYSFSDIAYEIGVLPHSKEEADGYLLADAEGFKDYFSNLPYIKKYVIFKTNIINYSIYVAIGQRNPEDKDLKGWGFKIK